MLKNKFNQSLSPYLNRPLRSLNEVLNSRLEAEAASTQKATVSCMSNDRRNKPEGSPESVA